MRKMNPRSLLKEYGNAFVLLMLCILVSLVTIEKQSATSSSAAKELVNEVVNDLGADSNVSILLHKGKGAANFAKELESGLMNKDIRVIDVVVGKPIDARNSLLSTASSLEAVIVTERMSVLVSTLPELAKENQALHKTQIFQTKEYYWPNFLKRDNIFNVLKQVSVVAIIAIGMTLVIITTGIDLSVGSLIAFSGVVTALLIQALGGESPGISDLWVGAFAAVLLCGLIGMGTGSMITFFKIPAFIVTLGVMFIAKGLAFILSDSEPVTVENEAFAWLGRGSDFVGIPNSVLIMIVLFILAHILMGRTSIGRFVYAVGGNSEAARLSGVPVQWVLVFVYSLCGLLAGLGGVMEASLHLTGDPKAGTLVELQVIAAVVVGGTSLAGGQGKIVGTLIGALIIGVIRNGMNLTGVEAHMQSVVYGVVILIAVMVDQLKGRFK
mgnify:FL=1